MPAAGMRLDDKDVTHSPLTSCESRKPLLCFLLGTIYVLKSTICISFIADDSVCRGASKPHVTRSSKSFVRGVSSQKNTHGQFWNSTLKFSRVCTQLLKTDE